jgi:hypothetical protein
MTWLKKYAPWVIIGILLVIIILLQQCGSGCPELPEPTVIHDTIPGDSVPYETFIPKPYPVFVEVPPDTFFKDMDTAQMMKACHAIARDYYSKRSYRDTLKDDTSAFVCLLDTVHQNQLQNRTLIFQNRRPTAINTTIYGEIPRHKVFIGPVIGRSLDQFAVGASVLWVTKKRFAYQYTYDVLNNDHYLCLYYKISFRKKDKFKPQKVPD